MGRRATLARPKSYSGGLTERIAFKVSQIQPFEDRLWNHSDYPADDAPHARRVHDGLSIEDRPVDSVADSLRPGLQDLFPQVPGHWSVDRPRLYADHSNAL